MVVDDEPTERMARVARALESQNEEWQCAMGILSGCPHGLLAVPQEILQTLETLTHEPFVTIVGVRG